MIGTFNKIANGFIALALSAGAVQASTTFHTSRASFDALVSNQTDPTGMSSAAPTATQADLDALTSDGISVEPAPRFGSSAPIDFGVYHLTNPYVAGNYDGVAHGFYIPAPGTAPGMNGAIYAIGNRSNENHGWSFDIDVFAFGFDWLDSTNTAVCVVSCSDSSLLMRAFDAADNLLGEATDPGIFGGQSFFGVTSDVGIRRLELVEGGIVGIDNEYFGNYVTGSFAAVPVPLSLPLLIGGLGLLGATRLRRGGAV